jgi:hypothetical protein
MKHTTAELEDALLDAAVAKAEGWTTGSNWCANPATPWRMMLFGPAEEDDLDKRFSPSSEWQDGGPIIEEEEIAIAQCFGEWRAWTIGTRVHEDKPDGIGPTPLIAAMRAYVSAKLGDEVDLP